MAAQLEQAKKTAGKYLRRTLWVLLTSLALFTAGYYFWRTYPKSEGTRIGVLFKISKKGYVFKTYEGQLQLGGAQMMTQQSVWDFSAKNAEVYQKLQDMEGKSVKCHYKELVNAFPWQGDTDYIVYDAELAK
jgi:hypothetical protein